MVETSAMSGLTTGHAPFVEEARNRGELYISQPYSLYSQENHEAWNPGELAPPFIDELIDRKLALRRRHQVSKQNPRIQRSGRARRPNPGKERQHVGIAHDHVIQRLLMRRHRIE